MAQNEISLSDSEEVISLVNLENLAIEFDEQIDQEPDWEVPTTIINLIRGARNIRSLSLDFQVEVSEEYMPLSTGNRTIRPDSGLRLLPRNQPLLQKVVLYMYRRGSEKGLTISSHDMEETVPSARHLGGPVVIVKALLNSRLANQLEVLEIIQLENIQHSNLPDLLQELKSPAIKELSGLKVLAISDNGEGSLNNADNAIRLLAKLVPKTPVLEELIISTIQHPKSDDQANLYGPINSDTDTDTAIKWYIANGATTNKLVMGLPLYGRAFENTNGIRQPFSGVGPGTWEAGVYDYKALPLSGAAVYEDSTLGSSYSYDSSKKELVSYDTPNIIHQKAAYIKDKGLGGGMFWELSSDKKGADSLVTISATNIGALDTTPNHLYYPYSQFDNVKNNMGADSSGPDTTVAPSPTTTQPPATPSSPITSAPVTTTTQAPGSGGCDGLSAWRSDVAYTGGNVVSYNGHKWTAKWWNQAETPGGASGAWTDNGSC